MNPPEIDNAVLKSKKLPVLLGTFIYFCIYSLTGFSQTGETHKEISLTPGSENNELFPRPTGLEPAIQFWKKVYTEISTSEGFIHDNTELSIIYEKIKVPIYLGQKSRSRYTKKFKKKYQDILTTLAGGKRKGLTKEEQRVLALWPKKVSNNELRNAKKRLRFQLGQSDKFKAGLVRSGIWKPFISKTLQEMDLPGEIAALPHVESSYNNKAYSKIGASGIWQFTRSTGRRFMRVDQVVDERMDPFIATLSAAQLIKNNYAMTKSWPLAITAYNHGASGMRRAVKKLGTNDIVTIIRKYKSRRFGFASRNFYAAFLAAVDIDNNPEKYFKNIRIDPPVDYEFVDLPAYISMDTVLMALNMDRDEFMNSNPALRAAVLNGNKYIPKDYKLRIDRTSVNNLIDCNGVSDSNADLLAEIFANLEPELLSSEQKVDRFHLVKKGQTLSNIAKQYDIPIQELMTANVMRNKHRIRVGQNLILPSKKHKKTIAKSVSYKKKSPKSIPIAVSEDGIYSVQPGDSIERIAISNALTVQQILQLNKLEDKNKIYVGQKLLLIKPEVVPEQTSQKPIIELAQLVENPIKTQKESSEALDPGLKKEELYIEKGIKTAGGDLIVFENEIVLNNNKDSVSEQIITERQIDATDSELLADPSDYTVSDQNTIEIQAAETLGHYAQWLQLSVKELRRLNKMKHGQHVVVGKRFKLSFSKISAQKFEAHRIAYHKTLQEAFFEQNQIIGSDKYRLGKGQSVWVLSRKTYKIPYWLLRQYNPDLDMNRIRPDKVIYFPKVKQRSVQES